MDQKQFDEIVMKISNALTRREAVKGLSGGALASAGIGAVAAESVDAAKNKGRGDGKKGRGDGKKGRGDGKKGHGDGAGAEGKGKRGNNNKNNNNNNNNKKKCKGHKRHCGRKHKCFNLQKNRKHCGRCGNACATGQFCSQGVCRSGT